MTMPEPDRTWLLWEMLSIDQQQALLGAFPGVDPPRRLDWESHDEIDRLMRQAPRGELALLLAGGGE